MCIHYIYPLIFKLKLQAFKPLNMTSVVGWEHHVDLQGRNNSGNMLGALLFSTSAQCLSVQTFLFVGPLTFLSVGPTSLYTLGCYSYQMKGRESLPLV